MENHVFFDFTSNTKNTIKKRNFLFFFEQISYEGGRGQRGGVLGVCTLQQRNSLLQW
jgi:hypothetical protein